jgi:uncharacterized phiE125 gp8 family phage protein
MGLKLVTPPDGYPISLEEAKKHCNVEFVDDDDLIEGLIAAATQSAEKFTGRRFLDQTWDVYLDAFPASGGLIEVPIAPLIEAVGVFYEDAAGAEQTYADAGYRVDVASEPGRVSLAYGQSWPSPAAVTNAVRVRVRVGYLDGSSPPLANVPKPIIQALKLTVGTWYQNRENVVVGQSVAPLPWAAEALLRQYRIEKAMA